MLISTLISLLFLLICDVKMKENTKTAFSSGEEIGNNLKLNNGNWDQITGKKGRYTFVKFFAPWCGHCSDMQVDWEILADHFVKNPIQDVDLVIGEIDCTSPISISLCLQSEVAGYPTIKMFKDGQIVSDYMYSRNMERMKKFLYDELVDISLLKSNSLGVFILSDSSFFKMTQSSSPVVVKLSVPWCPKCQELQQVWEDTVMTFLMEEAEDVKFSEIDCMKHIDTCADEGVTDYPSIFIYKDGMVDDIFTGDSTLIDLSNFVWENVDPSRVEEDEDEFGDMMAMMAGMMGGMEEEEEEECFCGEPGCDCSDVEYNDDVEEEEENEDVDYDYEYEDSEEVLESQDVNEEIEESEDEADYEDESDVDEDIKESDNIIVNTIELTPDEENSEIDEDRSNILTNNNNEVPIDNKEEDANIGEQSHEHSEL